ncbi:threonine--tRNA ligase [Candidatus Roizmanbacteria bacterium RIFOXYB2_FULL_38_10]|uniref:Threonine--tRNA ligase n=1 Tax=Candidatus Roizmanbacteria bacterium RIFOXYD1_FULL_38_12 TaxID=1802093 RepID=A0A1F7L0I0_9BACT|nr:MAG: threonine--tRNA ligase [Candidatus Roizmanbacteria bacterium RIFOXYA2_FULL_38_14]OGK63644.1 MAG: threonine--tRNA ligase [Candidatus Roizmanbacteria bacterium RIFOXYA1_FULL_37_12]OGK65490.1 MAG: threonine--tRNA ligase [Candidatus Roizmanbacteria bacterium RIFOXYB1_FULL_40_23]OGK68275.1 MAG: threonine--tRNA ligase [Candidatus Roizmanbacteria bacterium RIFOXYB2_FULL_38_10]OGK69895.1 MAG: threonine--tRNA ligase [Candidatus Roizmanbacteria bacterium RIFOXYC1_FULL_38_14]OGK72346.1 MAG: threo
MENQHLEPMRHSCEHVLHQAMTDLYPGLKRAMGPPTEDGFYFDFDYDGKISEEDFPKIEKRMRELVNKDLPIVKKDITLLEAKDLFKDNPYKLDWVSKIEQEDGRATVYWTGNPQEKGSDVDLCKGPHVASTGKIGPFKLLSVAGAYWHGDEKNKMLTRIYGTCFPTKEELDGYLKMIEEAKKRDHRKLGRELELFTMNNEVGQGITVWLPNGSIIRREIEDYMVTEQIKLGFKHVYSPHIGQKSLWEKSGHWDLYREKMYSPMDVDGVEYLVKPMTCPMHIQSFEFRPKSYRDLPYRIAEIGSVYRYEQSGELAGLLRVRAFTQDDAHIFCTQDQAVDEFLSVFNFINKLYKMFGFKDYRIRLGIRSKKEKYLGEDELWNKAQEKAIEALKKSGSDYFISEGDAAFYGPKADFLIKDALGREWQCGTVQIDFMLPERFGLKYVDHDGKEKVPVMIHRAPLGSLERFLAILIEHYAGAFPLWLAPVQAIVLPISDKHNEYGKKIVDELIRSGIRTGFDQEPERIGKKIRIATLQKIPYMIIIGDKEVNEGSVSVRTREGKDIGTTKITEFIQTLKNNH